MLSLTDGSKLSAKLLRAIDARREASGDPGSAPPVEHDILDR